MQRIGGFAAVAALLLSIAAAPGNAAAQAIDDPGNRSDTGDVRTSGISGGDPYSIMQNGPSAADWMGLSRSTAYWVSDNSGRSGDYRAQSLGTDGTAATRGNRWGWLGLLGLVGLWGLFNKSRMR